LQEVSSSSWRCHLNRSLRVPPLRLWSLLLIAFTASFAVFHPSASAQQAGHYVEGITGLENGTAPPPGFFATYLPYINHITELKGATGNKLLNLDLNLVAHNNVFAMTFPKKFLGGLYGFDVIIPVVNTRVVADAFDASAQSAGLSDTYFAPIVLGWEKGKANFTANYGFYAPTGAFDPSLALNPGLGFWEQQIQAGTTYAIDKRKLWNTSVLTTWEINQSKEGLDLKPGPMFTAEYSFGRRFYGYKMNAGLAGAAYHKLSADSGSDVKPITAGVLDRSFSIGPEWKYTNLNWHLGFDVRYEQQFGVQAKTQGPVFVIGITYLKLALPPPAAHK
jgi:hypothetical protein